jgi:hypothetical protein
VEEVYGKTDIKRNMYLLPRGGVSGYLQAYLRDRQTDQVIEIFALSKKLHFSWEREGVPFHVLSVESPSQAHGRWRTEKRQKKIALLSSPLLAIITTAKGQKCKNTIINYR